MMMSCENCFLTLGIELDSWNNYGIKEKISVDIASHTNSHMLITGMSGSGKSYFVQLLLAKLSLKESTGEFVFADYKGDDTFSYLRDCSNYYSYLTVKEALDYVYTCLISRQTGDTNRTPLTLVFDEYVSFIAFMIDENKKIANEVMSKVSQILMLGRSLGIRLVTVCQRPDALVFPLGSRLNYGINILLGHPTQSSIEMLMPDFRDELDGRSFSRGEGVVVLQGSELHFIKVPMVRDIECMRELCIKALGGPHAEQS